MEVRCTRNCKKKDKQGRCLAEAISIEETGCGAFIRVKKAKRADRKRPVSEMLLMMFRSAARERRG